MGSRSLSSDGSETKHGSFDGLCFTTSIDAVGFSQTLKSLELAHNDIGPFGMKYLAEALAYNTVRLDSFH